MRFSKCLLFADDLKLYNEIKGLQDCENLQSDISALSVWSRINSMPLNISKCKFMSYYNTRSPIKFSYSIDNIPLSEVTMFRDLGVIFDNKLSFKNHIFHIHNLCSRNLGMIKRNSRFFSNILGMNTLYRALVLTHINYCSIIWNPHLKGLTDILERLQKKYLRFILFKMTGSYSTILPADFHKKLRFYRIVDRLSSNDILWLPRLLKSKVNNSGFSSKTKYFSSPSKL